MPLPPTSPEKGLMRKRRKTAPLKDRFMEKVRKTGTCWLWESTLTRGGYGRFYVGSEGKRFGRAHRVSWEIHRGPIPEGLCVLHKCDIPPCVRPEHLFLGDKKENMQDAARKGRLNAQKHPERCARGESHGSAKLSNRDVLEIRGLPDSDYDRRTLAKKFRVSTISISRARNSSSWKHLNPAAIRSLDVRRG